MCEQINNAGMNKGFRPLVEFSDEEISEVLRFSPLISRNIYFILQLLKDETRECCYFLRQYLQRSHLGIQSYSISWLVCEGNLVRY